MYIFHLYSPSTVLKFKRDKKITGIEFPGLIISFRLYKLKFNCFTSCLNKDKSLDLFLNVIPIGADFQPMQSRAYAIPLFVSANPGRDSGLFIGKPGLKSGSKRPSAGTTSGLSGIPMKREPVWGNTGGPESVSYTHLTLPTKA